VAGGVQGVLQLAQGLAGLVQELLAAVDGIDPVLGQQGRISLLTCFAARPWRAG
jgi:hypothetical protein